MLFFICLVMILFAIWLVCTVRLCSRSDSQLLTLCQSLYKLLHTVHNKERTKADTEPADAWQHCWWQEGDIMSKIYMKVLTLVCDVLKNSKAVIHSLPNLLLRISKLIQYNTPIFCIPLPILYYCFMWKLNRQNKGLD